MYSILMIITSIVCILLMVIVLLQSGKGEGLAGTFGGAGGNMGQMFGTRRTTDFLSKGTWWLAGIMAFLALLINLFFLPGASTSSQRESIIQQSGRQNIPVSPTLPTTQAPQQQVPQNNSNSTGK